MFIINCIYKISKYKFSLFIITNVNALNELFYIIFYFLIVEKKKLFINAIEYRNIYVKLNIWNLIINIIDREKILINAYYEIFSDFTYIFCI